MEAKSRMSSGSARDTPEGWGSGIVGGAMLGSMGMSFGETIGRGGGGRMPC